MKPSVLMSISIAAALATSSMAARSSPAQRVPDTVYIPTPHEVVTAMLRMAHVGPGDVVYDLGSGDGRIVIAAVKEFGAARGVGIELDETRNREANENARRAGVAHQVEFRREDLFDTDLSSATVVTLYLSPTINTTLRPKFLAQLKPGARIVSHVFEMGDWMPDERRIVNDRPVFLWTIPEH